MDSLGRNCSDNFLPSNAYHGTNTRRPSSTYQDMDNRKGIVGLPIELLLIILSFLPPHSQITLGLTCKTLLYKVQPSSIVDTEVKERGIGIPHLTYLHLIKRDIPNSWVCYCCHRIHTTLLHPSFSSPNYISNLRSWNSLLPPIPPLPANLLLAAPPSYGSPSCIPFELSSYTSLLSPSASPFIDHKSDHSLPTASCDLRMAYSLHLTRIPIPNTSPSDNALLATSPDQSPTSSQQPPPPSSTNANSQPALPKQQQSLILSHARHTIHFHPRGVRVFSASYVFEQTQALRLDACQHLRLSADRDDAGNVVRGMLACAAGERRPTRPKGHGSCNRRKECAAARGSAAAAAAVTEEGELVVEEEEPQPQQQQGGGVGGGLVVVRRRMGRATHWVKCKVEGCGAEVCVWFDPKGVAGGSLGNGVMRMDIYKILAGQETNWCTNESTVTGKSRWEQREGPIEQLWKEKGKDIWSCLGDRELELLELTDS